MRLGQEDRFDVFQGGNGHPAAEELVVEALTGREVPDRCCGSCSGGEAWFGQGGVHRPTVPAAGDKRMNAPTRARAAVS